MLCTVYQIVFGVYIASAILLLAFWYYKKHPRAHGNPVESICTILLMASVIVLMMLAFFGGAL